MSGMKEKVEMGEGTAIVLLCARCKEPVKSGTDHICPKGEKDGNQNSEKEKTGD